MSKADELFDELGYTKKHDNRRHIVYKTVAATIEFRHKERWINVGFNIDMQELKAINEKVKELRLGVIKSEDRN